MKKILLFLSALILLLALIACPAGEPATGTTGTSSSGTTGTTSSGTTGGGTPGQPGETGTTGTTGTTGGGSAPGQPSGEAVYTVHVRDAQGERAENVVVRLTGVDVNKIALCEGGVARFTLPVGEYAVKVEAPEGDYYHEPLTLTPDKREGSVTLYEKLTKYTKVSAYNAAGNMIDDLRAYTLHEGSFYTTLKGASRSYFVFTPTRGGIYRISVSTEVAYEIGCFGNPLAALQISTVEPTEQGIFLDVSNSGVGGSFLIGVTTGEGESANAVITVERTSDPSLDIAELPWIDREPAKPPVAIDLAGDGEVAILTDLDITDANLTVVLGADGFYHLGTADGAIVYLRIGTASAYLDSFYDICSVSRFGAYFYNEDGSFDRKESYNLLIEAYNACADEETGLYPLTEDLAYVMQVMGEYYGWWNAGSSIFGTTPVIPAVAWLFACVTVEVVSEADENA